MNRIQKQNKRRTEYKENDCEMKESMSYFGYEIKRE